MNLVKDNTDKQQEEMSAIYKISDNPLSGCLPQLVGMPILFSLLAALAFSGFF